jgi:hypothetical protein
MRTLDGGACVNLAASCRVAASVSAGGSLDGRFLDHGTNACRWRRFLRFVHDPRWLSTR